MTILILFAFLAGVATIFAPCILPVLPVVLSAGISGGKRRPLGIVVGLVASFTFFTLSISWLTRHLGINPEGLRLFAIVVLLLFGAMLLIPKLLIAFEAMLSKLIPQVSIESPRTDFFGGVLIGMSLGLVWTPCVGPIVASVITLAASSTITLTSVLITAAYAFGTGVPLLILTYGGQNLLKRLRSAGKNTPKIQMAFGAVMVVTAVGMLFGLDRTLQTSLLSKLPSGISSSLTLHLEQSSRVKGQLNKLQADSSTIASASSENVGESTSGLPVLGNAREFVGITNWLNGNPQSITSLRGKVVLIDFWTYTCINCIRTLPHVTSWYDTYKDQGFVVIGVHSPEFAFEKESSNVATAIKEHAIHYPVAQDNDFATWKAYGNQYWPAEYLIDAQGRIRATHSGEGDYGATEENIRSLLKEAKVVLNASAPKVADTIPADRQSPETYLGTNRRTLFHPATATSGLGDDEWTIAGDWKQGAESITSVAAGNTLSYRFTGKDAYLIMTHPADALSVVVHVMLDGKPIGDLAGADAKGGIVQVSENRLYHLVHQGSAEGYHTVTLTYDAPGTEVFTFTFG